MTILDTESPPVEYTGRTVELAALVAARHPRPFALDVDNRNAGYLPSITAAVDSGTAYALDVAADVLAIDADDCRHLSTLDRLAVELTGDGWPVLRVDSGRDGHRHLWAVISDRAQLDRWTRRAADLDLPAPRATMRPPGSPHRLGLPVRLLDCPDTFTAAVEALRARYRAPRPARYDWAELLRTGRWWSTYRGEGTGSAMVWHVAIGSIRSGWTLDRLRTALADVDNAGGSAYRARLDRTGKQHADYWLEHYVWPSACRAAGRTVTPPADNAEAVAQLDTLRAAVEAAHWPGKGGATDRAVLLALIDAGRRHGTLTPTLSTRTLAEWARVSRSTVQRSTARLRAAGWLLVAELGRGRTVNADGAITERADATRWRLRLPESARVDTTGGTPPASTSLDGVSSRALDDVGRWRGVGPNGVRVLDCLASGPLSAGELGLRLDLNVGNLRARLLPRLARLGLLVVDAGRWSLVADLPAALAGAAVELGLEGKADAVRAQHDVERAGYLDYRELTRPVRSARSAARRAVESADRKAARRVDTPTLDLDTGPDTGPLAAAVAAAGYLPGTRHPATDPDPPPGQRERLAPAGIGSAGHDC